MGLMALRVKTLYASMFRDITGKTEETIQLERPIVKELLDYLTKVYGKKFKDLVIDPKTGDVTVEGGIFIAIGGHRVKMSDTISEGDTVAFLMGMAGG